MKVEDFIKEYGRDCPNPSNKFVAIRGCSGSGKTFIVKNMLKHDPDAFNVTWSPPTLKPTSPNVILTCIPNFNIVCIGPYLGIKTSGGGDNLYARNYYDGVYEKFPNLHREIIEIACKTRFTVLYESMISTGIFQPSVFMYNGAFESKRDVYVVSFITPPEVCKGRIMKRNGGKEIKIKHIIAKYKALLRLDKRFMSETPFKVKEIDNTNISEDSVLDNFFNIIGEKVPEGYRDNFGIKLYDDW